MSQYNQNKEKDLDVMMGLDDLELQLLEYAHGFEYSQAERMGRLLLNPEYLNIWINAKPNTLH